MSTHTQQIRRNILRLYLVVSLLMIALTGIGVQQAWSDHIANTTALLIRNATAVSSLVQNTLIDTSKVLDIARMRLNERLRHGSLTPAIASNILEEVSNDFTFYRQSDMFGLLFCTDAEGRLYGKSGQSIRDGVDLSDRYYFQALKTHPYQQFSIGNLVQTRTTNKKAFHLAMSLQDRLGNFAGVITQQIIQQDLSDNIQGIINNDSDQTYTYAPNGEVAFVYPSSALDDKSIVPNAAHLLKIVDEERLAHGAIKISGDKVGLSGNIYAGYAWSPQLGIYTISILPESRLFFDFAQHNLSTAIFGVLSFLIATALFIRLYSQALKLESSQFCATHDTLTGLSNRRAMDEEFERLRRESMRAQQPISVLFMDIDHFKVVNDTYGHEIGDVVLKAVGQGIQNNLHRPLDLCCRWGGEEFLAVLPDTPLEGALSIANHIMNTIRSIDLKVDSHHIKGITISIGICSQTVNSDNLYDDQVEMADRAMLKAKADGRDRIVVASVST